MSKYPQQVIERAAEALKNAKVSEGVRGRYGFVQWRSTASMYDAFKLFNDHSGKGPYMVGCASCHAKVFNWLLEVVLSTVEVGQTSIDTRPGSMWSDEPEDLSAFQR